MQGKINMNYDEMQMYDRQKRGPVPTVKASDIYCDDGDGVTDNARHVPLKKKTVTFSDEAVSPTMEVHDIPSSADGGFDWAGVGNFVRGVGGIGSKGVGKTVGWLGDTRHELPTHLRILFVLLGLAFGIASAILTINWKAFDDKLPILGSYLGWVAFLSLTAIELSFFLAIGKAHAIQNVLFIFGCVIDIWINQTVITRHDLTIVSMAVHAWNDPQNLFDWFLAAFLAMTPEFFLTAGLTGKIGGKHS